MKPGKLTPEQIDRIRTAPRNVSNRALAKEMGVTAQYVGQIRKRALIPLATRMPEQDVAKRMAMVRGLGSTVQMRAKAAEDMLAVVLICLDDLKRTPHDEKRERRVSVLARAFRDVAEATVLLKQPKTLEDVSDDELRAALKDMAG